MMAAVRRKALTRQQVERLKKAREIYVLWGEALPIPVLRKEYARVLARIMNGATLEDAIGQQKVSGRNTGTKENDV